MSGQREYSHAAMLASLLPILQQFAKDHPSDPMYDDAHAAFYAIPRLIDELKQPRDKRCGVRLSCRDVWRILDLSTHLSAAVPDKPNGASTRDGNATPSKNSGGLP